MKVQFPMPIITQSLNKKNASEIGTLMPTTLALSLSDGVVIASFKSKFDNTLQFPLTLHEKVGKSTLVTASGDLSDFQSLMLSLHSEQEKIDIYSSSKYSLSTKEIINYLGAKNYEKRGKMAYNHLELCIAGVQDGENVLGYVDKYGSVLYKNQYVVTHFGQYLLKAVIENELTPQMTIHESLPLIKKCFEILGENTKFSSNTVNFMTLDKNGNIRQGEINIQLKFDN